MRATGAVGEAKTFASHTWGAKWGGLVSALADGMEKLATAMDKSNERVQAAQAKKALKSKNKEKI